jgi:hypothetical protein
MIQHLASPAVAVQPFGMNAKRAAGFMSLIVACVAGFALVATALQLVISRAGLLDRDTPMSKIQRAAEQRPDLIFVGPSHLATGIIPEIFDAELSRFAKVRSYNMAMGGLSIPEIDFSLKRLFAIDPGGIKYVIIHPGFMMTDVARVPPNMRSIDYFDLPNALRFWSFLTAYDPTPPLPHVELLDYARNIIFATLRHYSHIGLGLKILGAGPDPGAAEPRESSSGHIAYERAMTEHQIAPLRADVEKAESAGAKFQGPPLSDGQFSIVAGIIDLIERQGARAILVRPPNVGQWSYDASFVRKYRQDCPNGPPLLDFTPAAFPELYEGQYHVDGSHLNVRGATIWSKVLADQVGELIRSGRLDKPAFCVAG